jgi:hypothetical protein
MPINKVVLNIKKKLKALYFGQTNHSLNLQTHLNVLMNNVVTEPDEEIKLL